MVSWKKWFVLKIAGVALLLLASDATAEDEASSRPVADPHESSSSPAESTNPTLVIPGPQGVLSTFRVHSTTMRPLEAEVEAALGSFCEESEDPEKSRGRCKRPPRVEAFDSELMDLSKIAKRRHVVYLGARLRTKSSARVHLLLGARGGASVQLDGVEVAVHESGSYRSDQTLARLELSPGDHALVLRFEKPKRGRWRAQVRLLDHRFRPGIGPVEIDVGTLDDDEARRLGAKAINLEELHQLGKAGPEVVLRLSLPGGGVSRELRAEVDGEKQLTATGSVHDAVIEQSLPFPVKGNSLGFEVSVEGRRFRLGQWIARDRPVLAAQAALEAALERAPDASKAPLAWRAAELARIISDHDHDGAWRNRLSREASKLVKAVDAGENPFASIKGYSRMAFFSELDDTPQPYELFVPPAYNPEKTRRWPLVITLHGFKGNAGDYFRNTFGLPRNYAGGESLMSHGRHGKAPRRGPMFVIAPTGRGQAMYRHAGEMDILEALADVQRRFRIDSNRIYITGGSMGGTGAAYLPYRNPDLFAASAALAGYHDQRVRSDTDHEGLSAVERFLQAERSDVDWAENGMHLHTLLVRGTKDMPLLWTRRLARRLAELRYPHEHREPELGHNVWTETYAEGAIFRYFAPRRRPEAPRHVHFRTARERTHRAWWVEIDQRAAPDLFGDVEARIDDGRIIVTTEGVQALTLSPGEELIPAGPLRVEIDGTTITGVHPLALHKSSGGCWEATNLEYPPQGHKRPGVSGPIRDVYHEPLIFVIGTQDPNHTLINRIVARHWARPKGWTVNYPIVDDVDVTDEMIREHNLVLIGPPQSNLLTERWAQRLPLRFEDDAISVGSRRYNGRQLGTVFVAPNPDVVDQALLIIAGPSPLGTWRSLCLPDILADYAIFDEGIAPARGRWAAGGTGAEYLEAGFFGMDWSTPSRRPTQGAEQVLEDRLPDPPSE